MTRIDLNRIVTAVALTALAVALGVWLSKPPLTAAPPADVGLELPGVPQVAPADPIPVLGPAVPIDPPHRKEEIAEIEVKAVVAPLPKIAEPPAEPAAVESAPANACPRQYYYPCRGLFRRR